MSMKDAAAISAAAVSGKCARRQAIEARHHVALQTASVERMGQSEASSRHKGDCGR
jgi:hypothetical protein